MKLKCLIAQMMNCRSAHHCAMFDSKQNPALTGTLKSSYKPIKYRNVLTELKQESCKCTYNGTSPKYQIITGSYTIPKSHTQPYRQSQICKEVSTNSCKTHYDRSLKLHKSPTYLGSQPWCVHQENHIRITTAPTHVQ